MTEDQFKQPAESQTGTTQEELVASTPVGEPGAEQAPGDEQAASGEQAESAKARQEAADDFRDSLSNLSSALDRFGKAAEARVRQEWEQGRPEINRAVDEMKRGLDGLIRKSSSMFDTVSQKLNKDDASGSAAPSQPGPGSATQDQPASETPAQTDPAAASGQPGQGDISGNQHSSPVDFPPPAPSEPASPAPDEAPGPPRDTDPRP